jgi:hypothetical protein
LFIGLPLWWVKEGDAEVNRGRLSDDSLLSGFIGSGSSQGRPGEGAGLFKVVGVSAKGGVEVFTNHEAGFEGVGIIGFYDSVYLLVLVLVLLDWDDVTIPIKVVSHCGEVGVDRGSDFRVRVVLGGEDDEEVRVVYRGVSLDGHCWLGVGGEEGELADAQERKDAKDDPATVVCHGSFHHHQDVILFIFYYLNLLCYTLTIIIYKNNV